MNATSAYSPSMAQKHLAWTSCPSIAVYDRNTKKY